MYSLLKDKNCFNNYDEWLIIILSSEKDKLRTNVHISTFFSIHKEEKKKRLWQTTSLLD